jgi:hypothetical protein
MPRERFELGVVDSPKKVPTWAFALLLSIIAMLAISIGALLIWKDQGVLRVYVLSRPALVYENGDLIDTSLAYHSASRLTLLDDTSIAIRAIRNGNHKGKSFTYYVCAGGPVIGQIRFQLASESIPRTITPSKWSSYEIGGDQHIPDLIIRKGELVFRLPKDAVDDMCIS